MKCFRHPGIDAVGTCKVCSKGLCAECGVDLMYALVCRGSCEAEAIALDAQIRANRKILLNAKRNRYFGPTVAAMFGVVFLTTGLLKTEPFNFATAMGILALIVAAIALRLNTRWAKDIDKGGA